MILFFSLIYNMNNSSKIILFIISLCVIILFFSLIYYSSYVCNTDLNNSDKDKDKEKITITFNPLHDIMLKNFDTLKEKFNKQGREFEYINDGNVKTFKIGKFNEITKEHYELMDEIKKMPKEILEFLINALAVLMSI